MIRCTSPNYATLHVKDGGSYARRRRCLLVWGAEGIRCGSVRTRRCCSWAIASDVLIREQEPGLPLVRFGNRIHSAAFQVTVNTLEPTVEQRGAIRRIVETGAGQVTRLRDVATSRWGPILPAAPACSMASRR